MAIALILGMTFSGACGAFFFKAASARMTSIFSLLRMPKFYIGCVMYLIGAVLNIVLLRSLPFSVAYPATALTYVWTLVFSRVFLQERVGRNKILGVLCIIIGVLLLAQ